MNIKYLNESFKKLYEEAIDTEPKARPFESELQDQLNDALMRLQFRGATNIKEYEIAFQQAIENMVPDKSWWEVTDCNILVTLFETRSPELTVEQILAELKPEYKGAVEENLEELLDADIDLNLDASGASVGFLGGVAEGNTNEALNESSNKKIAQIPVWAYNMWYRDMQGQVTGDISSILSMGELMEIWNDSCDTDPSMQEFASFDEWWAETKSFMEESAPRDSAKYNPKYDAIFTEALEECLNKLNEATISDEDKRDSDLIRSMLAKIQKRKNARFTPEEQAVLDKYGIKRNPYNQNLDVDNVPLDRHVDRENSISSFYGNYNNGNKPMINYADRARKTPLRRDNQVWGPDAGRNYRSAGNDWVNKHKSKKWGYDPGHLQTAERDYQDVVMQEPVNTMKNALRDRKYHKKYMDSAQADYAAAVEKAKKAYDDAVRRAGWARDDAITGYHKKGFDRGQQEIDTLLKRKPKED